MEKKWFQIPKHLAQGFDGNKLILNIIESDAKNLYVIDEPPSPPNNEMQNDNSETTVPLIRGKASEPSKREVVEEATMIRKP